MIARKTNRPKHVRGVSCVQRAIATGARNFREKGAECLVMVDTRQQELSTKGALGLAELLKQAVGGE